MFKFTVLEFQTLPIKLGFFFKSTNQTSANRQLKYNQKENVLVMETEMNTNPMRYKTICIL